jgi:Ca2+-binding RTX toxin-like protein
MSPADINFTAANGTFVGGINIIFGRGADVISIEGIRSDSLTAVSGNEGNDIFTIKETVVQAAGGSRDEGNDRIDASATPAGAELVIIGGANDDTLYGGEGDDVIFGDEVTVVRDTDYSIIRFESDRFALV